MNWLDIVIIVVAGALALTGLRMGGIHIAVTAAGIFAGIALATRFQDDIEPHLFSYIDNQNAAELAAFLLVFVAALVASVVVGFMLRSLLSKLMLGWADHIAGIGVGVIATFVIGSAVLSTLQEYPVLGLEDTIDESVLGTFLADNFDVVLRGIKMVPGDLGT